MVGGVSRNSSRPFAATKLKAPANSRRICHWWELDTSSENTNLKGLTSFIVRNVLNNVAPQCGQATSSVRTITSSENVGDVMVENTSATMACRWSPRSDLATQATTSRDLRTLSRDKLNSGSEGE